MGNLQKAEEDSRRLIKEFPLKYHGWYLKALVGLANLNMVNDPKERENLKKTILNDFDRAIKIEPGKGEIYAVKDAYLIGFVWRVYEMIANLEAGLENVSPGDKYIDYFIIRLKMIRTMPNYRERLEQNTIKIIKGIEKIFDSYRAQHGSFPKGSSNKEILNQEENQDGLKGQIVRKGEWVDMWGNPLHITIVDEKAVSARYYYRIWSNGRNCRNEDGNGDDIYNLAIDDICEVAFRHIFSEYMPKPIDDREIYYVFPYIKGPYPGFLKRFSSHKPPVKSLTQNKAEIMSDMKIVPGGQFSHLFFIISFYRMNAYKADFDVKYRGPGNVESKYIFKIIRENDKWVVKEVSKTK
jgi:hypothetical protein